MEFAPLAAARSGGDVHAAQTALLSWFVPVVALSAVTFAIGVVPLATAIGRSQFLSRPLTWLVAGALIIMAAARFVPLAAVQFYVQGAAAILALWRPLGHRMWTQSRKPTAGPARTAPATASG